MDETTRNYTRTIIVKLLNYKDKETILDTYKKKKFWEEKLYINEDFSEKTLDKRRELFRQAKELRS